MPEAIRELTPTTVLPLTYPDLIASHVRASDISFDTAFGLENGMPIEMHAGAERFRATFDEGR